MTTKPKLSDLVKKFDKKVRQKKFAEAIKTLSSILQIVETAREGFGGGPAVSGSPSEREATVMASAITSLLADKDFKMDMTSFRQFAQFKRAISQVFEVSGYRGTDHFVEAIGEQDEKGNFSFKPYELPKLFAGLSINALNPTLLKLLARQKPEFSWPLVVGFLSEQLLWRPQAEQARGSLLMWGDKWQNLKPTFDVIRNLGPAYMGCSYADAPHKHQIKKAMNHLARGYLESRGVTDADLPEPRRPVKKRPTVMILAELYDSKHAMHRCYGPSIKALKSKFKTVYMSLNGTCDEALVPMFDKVDKTKFDVKAPETFIDKVKSYRPDIIYFPSIGMRLMSILGSNVRMAPIQLFTPGHPATTNSEYIDYILLIDGYLRNPDCYSEKVLTRRSQPYFTMRDDASSHPPVIREKPATVRLAVPAWSRKVTPNFISICAEIQKRAKNEVEFWFFPNGLGVLYQAVKRRIEEALPAKVLPRTNYNDYIKWLNQCDIYLSTTPFGSTNGLVDGSQQGLPVVNMKGDEAHSMIDSDMLRDIGQPDWLSAEDREAYINAAVRLIDNHEERVAITKSILESDPASHFLVKEDADMTDFVEIFEQIYRHHEQIMASNQKVFSHDQLIALDQ
ncbi:MAG: hypothetical protein HWE39_03215 [Oceanospirillaceae bacterium]|nr:hypothetical protein [Oceanospirillaceae bacterium]